MTNVVSLTGYRPSPRYDGNPWTQALIQESADDLTFSTLETVTFNVSDPDPTDPAEHNFTTTRATLASGWYRVVFKDAASHQEATSSTFVGAPVGNLTTVGAVRQFMQKTGEDEEQDALITELIPKASRAIQRYTRVFLPETASKTFTYRGRGMLSLSPYFCRNVTAVAMAGDTASLGTVTPLAAGGYSLEPDPAEDGVYTHIRFPGSQLFESNLELLDVSYANAIQQKVRVTGDWGYVAVPEDVEHWANVTIREWIMDDVSAYAAGAGDPNIDRLDRPEDIPFKVKRGLRQYRRDDAAALPTLAAPKPRAAEGI